MRQYRIEEYDPDTCDWVAMTAPSVHWERVCAAFDAMARHDRDKPMRVTVLAGPALRVVNVIKYHGVVKPVYSRSGEKCQTQRLKQCGVKRGEPWHGVE